MMTNRGIKELARTGLFVALTVIMSYILAIHTTFVHITFGFIPTAIFAIMYGPIRAGIMAAIACLIGMTLFGRGVFFPGFMVTEFLVGCVYGYWLYNRPITIRRICIPELIVTVCLHLGLNTLWLVIYYNKAISAIFMSRLIKNIICFPLEVALIFVVYKGLEKWLQTYRK
ncbi:membrane protein [Veillonella montpellierensis DNF00314]|uniref:Membrane protein n=1 Tax=Veillonella montpellierensis DNF00314 TaxID=1401067 RepID=A0A096BXP3_9FIRM|nr:folate family ECF transporter S component [Veillonella montpellierensis]KGF47512.1 membrane protein [Veillonella montpellierensis DNF00314]